MKGDNQLTAFQHFALIVAVVGGTGIFTLPRIVAAEAGRSAWLIVLATGLAITLLALLANNISSSFPDLDASEWPKTLLGPVLGRVWLTLYLARTTVVVFITAQIYGDILGVRQYPLTPCPVTAILVMLLSILLVSYGVGALARYAQLTFLISIPLLAVVPLAMATGSLDRLLPLLGDKPLMSLLKAAPPVLYSTLGYDILWFSYPHLQRKSRSGLAVLAAMLFIALTYTLITVAATVSLGPNRLTSVLFPTLTMLSQLELGIVARVDTVVLYLWILSIVATAGGALYISSRALSGLWQRLQFPKTAVYLGLPLLAASLWDMPPRRLTALSRLVGAADIILLSISLLVFKILCMVRKGRGKGAKEH